MVATGAVTTYIEKGGGTGEASGSRFGADGADGGGNERR